MTDTKPIAMNNTKEMFFSIGIPAFKGEHLRECIESVLNQSYEHFELIIINDASPDPVNEIVSEFSDSRISYSENAVNIGAENLVNNWNKCLDKASGEYFVLMGDDDTMQPDYLEQFLVLMKRFPGLAVYHCRSNIIDKHSKPIMITPSWPEYESVYESIWHRNYTKRIHFISDFVYKTSELKKNSGFYFLPMGWASDDISFYRAARLTGVAHFNTPLLNYRKHPKTLSNSGNLFLKMDALMLHKKWLVEFLAELPANPRDQLYCKLLRAGLNKDFQKEKVMVMKASMHGGIITNIVMWYKNKSKYKISFKEIIYATLLYLKTKLVGKKYD